MFRKKFLWVMCISVMGCFLLVGCSEKEKEKEKEKEEEVNTLVDIQGIWEGSIQVPNQPLAIIIQFTEAEGTIDIPVQGISQYSLSNISYEKPGVDFEMNIQGQKITFEGNHTEDKIAGTFTQNDQSFPFELTRYDEEDLVMEEISVNDGKLKGQIEIPEGEGPFPVMIIHAGSGPTDRDGNSIVMGGKNNSLKLLAEGLAEEGIASIRYDKRGVGMNSSLVKKEEELQFDDYIDDLNAWLQFAKEDNRFTSVGIIGHSEGSLIGLVAGQEEADLFISLAGPGRPMDDILKAQLKDQLPANLLEESNIILEKLKQGKQVEQISPDLSSLFRPSVQPYLISMLKYDPTNLVAAMDIPVLIIIGDRDIQVSTEDAALLKKAKPDAELTIFPRMNHVLKEAPEDREGNIATYTNPDLPLADTLLEAIVTFIKKTEKR